MNKDQLKRYAELKIQATAIDAELKELQPLVLSDILESQLDKVPTSLGNFNIKKRKVWKYSPAVESEKEILDKLKETEEADGTATFEEVAQLEFRQTKPQE
jgi:hypothetical protein